MASTFEGYRFDEPANPDPNFPKVVNSRDLNIDGKDIRVYERPTFVAEIMPAIAEIKRQSYHTDAPGQTLHTLLLVVDEAEGFIGVLGVR